MSVLELFPTPKYTRTELDIIAECMNNPSVKKYLTDQMNLAFSAIAEGEPQIGQSAEEYLRKQAGVQGMIRVFRQLLSIEKAPQPQSPN